jgi:hypothetical protein
VKLFNRKPSCEHDWGYLKKSPIHAAQRVCRECALLQDHNVIPLVPGLTKRWIDEWVDAYDQTNTAMLIPLSVSDKQSSKGVE